MVNGGRRYFLLLQSEVKDKQEGEVYTKLHSIKLKSEH